MKKPFTLLAVLLLICLFPAASFASEDGIMFGLKLGQETVSPTDDVKGGSYLALNPLISFNQTFSLNLKYLVNMAPESFTDQLISITPQINFKKKRNVSGNGADQSYFGVCYLKSAANDYYGLTYSPLCLGRSSSSGSQALIDLIPLTYLYSPQTGERIIMFELINVGSLF